jgi:predicted nucleotidyltransferase
MCDKLAKEAIVKFLKDNKHILSDRFNVEELTIIGSIANDSYSDHSDVDLVYKLKDGTNLNFNLYMKLIYWLEKNFGRKVDLISSKNMNPAIKIMANKSTKVVI